jgi:hypothetical protein
VAKHGRKKARGWPAFNSGTEGPNKFNHARLAVALIEKTEFTQEEWAGIGFYCVDYYCIDCYCFDCYCVILTIIVLTIMYIDCYCIDFYCVGY